MKFLVKSDQYAFRLYRPGGELPETLPEHRVEGHRCIGHFTTVLDLLKGARQHLAKARSKRAQELTVTVDEWIKMMAADESKLLELARRALSLVDPR